MNQKGRFITIEGGEGAGKSTLISNLANWLSQHAISFCVSREPGGTQIADSIRAIFSKPPVSEVLNSKTELMLVSAARSQHVEHLLQPTLAKGTWIICDRYADSTRVYQGDLGGIDPELIERVINFTTNGLVPDLTFIMDCPVDIALKRLQKRDKGRTTGAIRYDSASSEFHQKLRDAHLRLAKRFSDRIVLIDASHSPEESLRQAIITMKERFSI